MRKQLRKKDKTLTIPFKMVIAIMSGMIFLLSIYIYSNYFVAAHVFHLHDAFQSGVDSCNPSQSVRILKESHTRKQKFPGQHCALLSGSLKSF